MIELKEINPPCMTETSRSRATQEQENYSILKTQNESELSYMLVNLSSRVDIITNSEEAKNLIFQDTRKDLQSLIDEIEGKTKTIEAIKSKQVELENAVSSLLELKKAFSNSEEDSSRIEISIAMTEKERSIIALSREIKNLKRISDIFGSTIQEESKENNQEESEKIDTILKDENQKRRLISILENENITSVLPINETSRKRLLKLLNSESLTSESLVIELKKSFEDYQKNTQRTKLVKILEFAGLNDLIRTAKENIYLFLVTILRFDFTISADSSLEAISSLALEFSDSLISLAQQDNIENRILRRQFDSINLEIKRINPRASNITMNQLRKLTTLPLKELLIYCEAHSENTACLVIKRMISNNKSALLQKIMEKIQDCDEYTPLQKQKMLHKIQTGGFNFEKLKFSTLLAFIDNSEDNQFWDQMQGRSVYYASKVGQVWSRTINMATLSTEAGRLSDINLQKDLTFPSPKPNTTTYYEDLLKNSQKPHQDFLKNLESKVTDVCNTNTVKDRNALKTAIQEAAAYKLELQRAYTEAKSLPAGPERTKILRQIEGRLIELHSQANRLFGARTAAIGDYIERKGAGRRLDRISGSSSRIERIFSNRLTRTVGATAKWGLVNGVLSGAPQIYNLFTGKCNSEQAIKNTLSTMRYCIPVYGSYLSWRDFGENPSLTGFTVAACSTVLDVAGLPLKLAGLAGRLGFGLVKTTGLNTVLRAASSTATKVLMTTIGGSLMLDYLLQEEAGTSMGATLRQSYKILGIANQVDDYIDMSPLERLEDQVIGEIDYQVESIRSFEESDHYSTL